MKIVEKNTERYIISYFYVPPLDIRASDKDLPVNYVVVALTWLRKGHWFDVTLFVLAAATRSRGRWPINTRPPWSLGSPPPASLCVSWSLACRGSGGARIPGGSLQPLHPRQHCNPLAWQPQCRLMLFLFWPPSKCRRKVAYLTTSSCRGRQRMYEAAVQHDRVHTCWISEERRCTVDDERPRPRRWYRRRRCRRPGGGACNSLICLAL